MTPASWAVCGIALLLVAFPYATALLPFGPGRVLLGEPHPDPLVLDDSDAYEGCWHFWWTERAISEGLDPRHCALIFPPGGASLAYQHIGWVDTYIAALSGLSRTDPVLAYNLTLLAGTFLTALFGWLLARSWGLGPLVSVMTALMIAWLPARTARVIQHYQLADCWTMIASLWLCRSWMRRGGLGRYAGFTAATAAAALQSPFLGLFCLAGVPLTAWIARVSWKRAAVLSAGALAGIAAGFLMVVTAPGGAGSPAMDSWEAVHWAAEPQSFLLPSPFGIPALLAGLPPRMPWMPNTQEGVVGPGMAVLLLLLLAAWKRGGWRYAAVSGALFLLCLGPELKLCGIPRGVPLPFALLRDLPVAEGIRAPSRFALLGGVFAVLGAGAALSAMDRGWRRAAAGLILIELFVPVLPVVPAGVPAAILSIAPEETVLEIPVMENVRRYALFQTRAGYARSYAFLARPPAGAVIDDFAGAVEAADVVVYHRGLMEPGELARADSLASRILGISDLSGRTVWLIRPGSGGEGGP